MMPCETKQKCEIMCDDIESPTNMGYTDQEGFSHIRSHSLFPEAQAAVVRHNMRIVSVNNLPFDSVKVERQMSIQ